MLRGSYNQRKDYKIIRLTKMMNKEIEKLLEERDKLVQKFCKELNYIKKNGIKNKKRKKAQNRA
jgi:hypothetical protein